MEIRWTKPKEATANWDDAKIKAANLNSGALNNLFSVVIMTSSRKYSLPKLLRKHRLSSRQLMKGLRLLRIQSFKGLP